MMIETEYTISQIKVHPELKRMLLIEIQGDLLFKEKGQQIFIDKSIVRKSLNIKDYNREKEDKWYKYALGLRSEIYNFPEKFSELIEIVT